VHRRARPIPRRRADRANRRPRGDEVRGLAAAEHRVPEEIRSGGAPMELKRSSGLVVGFWISTVLLCLQLGFTAYAQLQLPQVADAFKHLGYPGYFRVELSWAKFLGIAVLLAPVPARLKEWAYAGF